MAISPQLRTQLVRKLKNIEPNFTVEFVEDGQRISFRVKDAQGRYQSKIIEVSRKSDLETQQLRWLLKRDGFSGKSD